MSPVESVSPATRRRLHKKSRSGCAGCKQQRKKCDEQKPTCGNCERRRLTCSLSYLTTREEFPSVTPSPPPSLPIELDLFSFDLQSLELIYHYTTVASLTLASPRGIIIWQTLIPQMAFTNSFLMHGMLAISALHLASLIPHRRTELVLRAATSEHIALQTYRNFIAEEDPESLNTALVFGAFIVPYVLAISSTDLTARRLPTLDDVNPHWFFLVRGIVQLATRTWPALKSGPFAGMITQNPEPIVLSDNPEDDRLSQLYGFLGDSDLSNLKEHQVKSACRSALDILRETCAIPYSRPRTVDVRSTLFIWPGSISQEFIVLLHERRPEALVILAHYCVVLKKYDGCWYLENIGKNMLEGIEEVLDPRWRKWIEWPLEYPSR